MMGCGCTAAGCGSLYRVVACTVQVISYLHDNGIGLTVQAWTEHALQLHLPA